MYKKTYTTQDKAVRIGFSTSFNNNNTSGKSSSSGYSDSRSFSISLTIGKEKQKRLSGKWGIIMVEIFSPITLLQVINHTWRPRYSLLSILTIPG